MNKLSKDLKTRVKVDTKSAIRSLNALEKKINKIESTINKTNTTSNTLGRNINRAVTPTNSLARSSNKVRQNFEKSNSAVSKLTSKVKKLAGAYLGVMGARALMNTSDTITSAENRLNALNGGNRQHTQDSLNKMYASAQNSRMGYTDMIANASKSMTLAGEAFQGNIDNAIRFQEIMAKSYTLGGASAAEQASSMYQMIQALGSGVLQGDELRSVREGAPLAYKAIEEFAQGVYNTEESLKDMASQGLITSDMVVAAMMDAGQGIDEAFANTEMTFAQAFNNMKNTAIKAFEPVLQMLRDTLDSKLIVGLMQAVTVAIQVVAGVLQILFGWISKIYHFIADNWSVISKVLLTIALIIGVLLIPKFVAWVQYMLWVAYYYIYIGACAVASAIKTAVAWAIANWQMALIILVIIAIIAALVWLSDGFADACGIIVGVIMAAVSVIWNLFVTFLIYVIQSVILPFATAWQTFANFFGNLFNDPIASIIYMFEGLAQAVLSILQTIANGIDAIFGSNLADAVQSWSKTLGGKADALAKKYGNGSYDQKSDAVDEVTSILNDVQGKLTWDTSDAYNTGYNWGVDGANWISGKLSDAKDWLSGTLNMDSLPGLGGYNLNGSYNMPSNDDLMKGVDNIDDNTGKVADSMKLAEEDLEYLRKLANLEWKKEYTTASINVDMKNYNTLEGSSDLDGIVTKLVDKLYEELDSVANGVYA